MVRTFRWKKTQGQKRFVEHWKLSRVLCWNFNGRFLLIPKGQCQVWQLNVRRVWSSEEGSGLKMQGFTPTALMVVFNTTGLNEITKNKEGARGQALKLRVCLGRMSQ